MTSKIQVLLVLVALLFVSDLVDAQRRGGGGRGGGGFRGGGGGGFRGGGGGGFAARGAARPAVTARPNISRPSAPPAFGNRTDIGRPGGINRPDNIVNRPVNIGDVDINNGACRYGAGCGCCSYHPVARAAAFAGAAAVTAAAIGSVTYALPSSCSVVVVSGITYEQCGSSWYQPQYVGTDVSYIVVAPPQ